MNGLFNKEAPFFYEEYLSINKNPFFLLVILTNLYAEDLRDFAVGSNIELVPERGYVNLNVKTIKKFLNGVILKIVRKIPMDII